ncbi:hypothetical protein Gogos_010155 [Gossypium gossypioides]|uniref:Endonuclease/exonuclease/phosphatase domain-containing protein n=1 Tax=Gossypium gossypioides TaxID=34282 RepID=A0A7J9BK94_GOSGO|nr:hypothetical protein [Gossypium gossypioides]
MNKNVANTQGYEVWAIGKIMAGEKINRDAMIYNIPLEQRNRQVAIDVGKTIEEVVAIDWMAGCLTVSSERRNEGLAMLWKDGVHVSIQNYSNHHIDSLILGRSVREDWIVGGDFNAIIDEAEKERGRRKPRVTMDKFRDVMEELALVDIKTDKGWFMWVNNYEGNNMVKERLDRFLISANVIDNLPFLVTNVVRQANSDHDAVLMDTMLVARIGKLIDGPYEEFNVDSLKTTRLKLGHLYAEEESY